MHHFRLYKNEEIQISQITEFIEEYRRNCGEENHLDRMSCDMIHKKVL
jgi:hypothetical protein